MNENNKFINAFKNVNVLYTYINIILSYYQQVRYNS